MRVAAIQMRSGLDPAENLEALEGFVAEAASRGARYVLSPEMTVLFAEGRARLEALAEPWQGNAQVARAGAIAKRHAVMLHLGSLAVRLEDGRFANRSVLFSAEGEILAHYDKIHLFDADIAGAEAYRESATYAGGDRLVLAPVGDLTVGFAVCYDLRFPKLFNALAREGATLMALPAAFTVPTGEAHWAVLARARAIETGSFFIAAAQGGTHENGRATFGHSMIVDPWGRVLAEADGDAPGIVLADLDPAVIEEARRRVPVLANERAFAREANERAFARKTSSEETAP